MKRFKFYVSMFLIVCMMSSVCVTAFAAQSDEFALSWLVNPVNGVSGYIYASTPYGFVIHDGDWENQTAALVDGSGVRIPHSNKFFEYVHETGYIEYYVRGENETQHGVMDLNGNDIIPCGKYDNVRILDKDRFVCVNYFVNDAGGMEENVAIYDQKGNAIVPFGKYIGFYWEGTIFAWDENDNTELIDYDGNVILSADKTGNVQLLSAKDRYLVVDEAAKKSYIRGLDGKDIVVLDGIAKARPYNFLEVEEYSNNNKDLTVYRYGYDGTLLETEFFKDFMGRPFTYIDIYKELDRYSVERKYENGEFIDYVMDKDGNQLYRSKTDIVTVHNKSVIEVADEDYSTYGLIDFKGNEIVPLGKYDGLYYSENLELYALSKNGKIYVAKVLPITVKLNDKKVEFDQNPVLKNDRTLVPVRAIFEALGATVEWDEATKTVTSTLGDKKIKLTIGSNIMYVNNAAVELDVAAEIISDRTLVPVRAISEAYDCKVDWDGNTRTVIIEK